MIWLLIVPLIVLYFVIQSSIAASTGHAPRSRASFRYQRRKARKMGVDPGDVPISPRLVPMSYDEERKAELNRKLNWLWVPAIAIWALLIGSAIFD